MGLRGARPKDLVIRFQSSDSKREPLQVWARRVSQGRNVYHALAGIWKCTGSWGNFLFSCYKKELNWKPWTKIGRIALWSFEKSNNRILGFSNFSNFRVSELLDSPKIFEYSKFSSFEFSILKNLTTCTHRRRQPQKSVIPRHSVADSLNKSYSCDLLWCEHKNMHTPIQPTVRCDLAMCDRISYSTHTPMKALMNDHTAYTRRCT